MVFLVLFYKESAVLMCQYDTCYWVFIMAEDEASLEEGKQLIEAYDFLRLLNEITSTYASKISVCDFFMIDMVVDDDLPNQLINQCFSN